MISAKAHGPKTEWQTLTGGPGYMGISLYSRNHQGNALAAMIKWINATGKFSSFRIGLSDTLNRFNTAHSTGIDLGAAYDVASKDGDQWLKENSAILEQLQMPYDVVRWSHWLENHSAEVTNNKDTFNAAFENQPAFRQAVLKDIEAYAERAHNKPIQELDTAEFQTSLDYLIEELAVYSVILKDFPATTVYPGRQLHCFAFMRQNQPEGLPDAIGKTGFIRLGVHGARPANDLGVSSPTPKKGQDIPVYAK